MTYKQYECYNTNSGEVEGVEWMDFDDAVDRNKTLRENEEPQRWLQIPDSEEVTDADLNENTFYPF